MMPSETLRKDCGTSRPRLDYDLRVENGFHEAYFTVGDTETGINSYV